MDHVSPRLDYTTPSWAARRRVLVAERDRLSYATFVDAIAGLYGPRTAFVLDDVLDYPPVFTGDLLSYLDVARLVDGFAGALRMLGVRRGDRVGLVTMNRIEAAFCSFACGKLGALPVPMNFMLKANEIEHVAQRAGIELVVTDASVLGGAVRDVAAVPSVRRWVVVGHGPVPANGVRLAEVLAEAPARVEPVLPSGDDETAMLFFTSGTTGFPKGAMLTHASTMIGVRNHGRLGALSPTLPPRRALAVMPVAHAAGYAMTLLNLALGIPSYFLSSFDPQTILDRVRSFRPTVFSGTPTMYRMLLAAGANAVDWSSISVFGGGADAFDDDLVRTVRELGARTTVGGVKRLPWFIRGYGMAEANSYVAQTPPFEVGDHCCGWVLPPVRHRLVDEDGRDVRRGEPGELLLKGPNLLVGYWNDPEATAEAFTDDGWFRTRDILREGRWRMLYFVGRSAEIIKSGGYKISANEIDRHFLSHPAVERSATIAYPHDVKGEWPVTAVQLRRGAHVGPGELLAWARERIAPYKCPRAVVVVDEVPLTFSMKPKRGELRARLLAEMPAELRALDERAES